MKPTTLYLAEQKRNVYYHVAPEGVPADKYLEPEMWVHVGKKLSPMDRVELFAEDGRYFAEFICLNAGPMWAHMHLLRCVELAPAQEDESVPEFDVKWGGPAKRYGVRRASDGEWLVRDCQTPEDAEVWLRNHMSALGH